MFTVCSRSLYMLYILCIHKSGIDNDATANKMDATVWLRRTRMKRTKPPTQKPTAKNAGKKVFVEFHLFTFVQCRMPLEWSTFSVAYIKATLSWNTEKKKFEDNKIDLLFFSDDGIFHSCKPYHIFQLIILNIPLSLLLCLSLMVRIVRNISIFFVRKTHSDVRCIE